MSIQYSGIGKSVVILHSSSATTLTWGDGSDKILDTITFQATGGIIKIIYSMLMKYGVAGQGLHVTLKESGNFIFPSNAPGQNQAGFIVKQVTEPELFCYSGILTPSTGQHTYELHAAPALGVATATIYNSDFIIEVYG